MPTSVVRSAPGSPWPTLQTLFSALRAETPTMSEDVAHAIRASLAFYRGQSLVSAPDLWASCEAHIDFLLTFTEGDGESGAPSSIGAERARAGIPLTDVLDALRVGSHYLWARLRKYARTAGTVTDAQLVDLASEMWLMHDELVSRMESGYRAEQASMLVTRERTRFSLVHTVLTSSDQPAPTLWEAVDRLGLPRTGGYVVVAAAVEQVGEAPLRDIDQRLAARGVSSVWVLLSDVQAGIVSLQRSDAHVHLESELALVGKTAGVSPRRDDFSVAAQAFRLARTALRASAPQQTTFFERSPLGVTVAAAPDVTEQVRRDVLRELLTLPPADQALLVETVQTWFRCEGSVRRAAETLYLHSNTVRNRLARFEALTGRKLSHPADAAAVLLALTARP